ncbi:MAG: hypothetical protein LBK94_12565 [Prevotellaceae bacterium]|jgi:endogenous inhibitor of DNA gyrase (YacG/DUF329 family)|nr:hypothetical protein [Prevotellaceae bacterium]
MCELCNGMHPSQCPVCADPGKQEIFHIACPACKGNNKHCSTCFGAGVTFNIDIDDVPDDTRVECPACGKTVEAGEISFNQCAGCNRKSDEAEEAAFEAMLNKIDRHIENIKEIRIPQRPPLFTALNAKTANGH